MKTDYMCSLDINDIVLEYSNIRIPIDTLNYTRNIDFDNFGNIEADNHFLNIKTYPVSSILKTVLKNIMNASLTVFATEFDREMNQGIVPDMVFDHIYISPEKYIAHEDINMKSYEAKPFEFELVSRKRTSRYYHNDDTPGYFLYQ